jgi:hypothetical protein
MIRVAHLTDQWGVTRIHSRLNSCEIDASTTNIKDKDAALIFEREPAMRFPTSK